MTTLLFTTKNPSLAKIAAYNSTQNWVNLAVKHLTKADQTTFLNMLSAICPTFVSGLDNYEELQVASIKFADEQFQRTYPVSLYSYNNNFAIKLGQTVVELENFLDAEIELFEVEQYEDPCLTITQETDSGDIVILPLPLRLNDAGWEAQKADSKAFLKKLSIAFKKANYSVILNYLLEATSERLPIVDIKTLPENTPIIVTNSKPVETKYGQSFVLALVHPTTEEAIQVWCPSSLKNLFKLGGQVTPGVSQLKYSTYISKAGKTLIDAKISHVEVAQDENDANIHDLF